MHVFEQRFELDGLALHFDLAHVGSRQKEQLIDDPRHAVDFFQITFQHDRVIARFARPPQRQLRFALHDRQRRPQFVRGVAAELSDLAEGCFEARDHVVERAGKPPDFVGGGRDIQPLSEIARGDALCRQRDRVHRPECAPGEEPAPGQRNRQRQRHRHHEDEQQPVQCLIDGLHRGAHLHDVEQVAAIDDRHGNQPQRRFFGILGRLEQSPAGERRLQRLAAERELVLFHVRGANCDGAGGTEDLEELVDTSELRKLGHQVIFIDERQEPPLFERAHGGGGGFFQRLVQRVPEVSSGNEIEDGRKGDEDQREGAAVPEGQSKTQRHQSAFSM